MLVAVQNLDFLGFLLGILLEFIYEMNTARRYLPKNDLFGIYMQMVYIFIQEVCIFSLIRPIWEDPPTDDANKLAHHISPSKHKTSIFL